jgi:hypothetical protein
MRTDVGCLALTRGFSRYSRVPVPPDTDKNFPIFEFELKFREANVVLNFRDLIKIPRDFEN